MNKALNAIRVRHAERALRRINHGEVDNGELPECLVNASGVRVVVYTCVLDNYDKVQEVDIANSMRYIMITDDTKNKVKGWNAINVDNVIPDELRDHDSLYKNRYCKMHPKKIFGKEYDYAIYIDGNIKIKKDLLPMIMTINNKTGLSLHRHQFRDSVFDEAKACILLKKGNKKMLKRQIKEYKREGMPKDFGLFECNVIVSDLRNPVSERILDGWWQEFLKWGSLRDQIALPYIIWREGFSIGDVGSLGQNVSRNSLIEKNLHNCIKKG